MTFNSIQFLIFFPVVTLLYFVLPNRFRWTHRIRFPQSAQKRHKARTPKHSQKTENAVMPVRLLPGR